MGGGGGKGGGSSNPNLDQITNSIMQVASNMQSQQSATTDALASGATTQDMRESVTGLPSEAQRIQDYNRSLSTVQGAATSPLESILSLGKAPGGDLYSGKLDPLAAAKYGQAMQEDIGAARQTNQELARQFGARNSDEASVLSTLQAENINKAKLNRSPLLTAMMDLSRNVEKEQRAADMQSYSANLNSAMAQGQALSPLLATLGQTSNMVLAGKGRDVQTFGTSAQQQASKQAQNQTQNQTSSQRLAQSQMQRQQNADDRFMQGRTEGSRIGGTGTVTPKV